MNKAFVGKAIDKAQHLEIGSPFCDAINEFLRRYNLLAWDDERGLFWVNHPQHGWQVAVWLMPVANQFEPAGA